MPEFHLTVVSDRPYSLGPKHKPYMVLPKGGTGPFSCALCDALAEKGGIYHCNRPEYAQFMGTTMLVDEKGGALDDPSRACSDWFFPK